MNKKALFIENVILEGKVTNVFIKNGVIQKIGCDLKKDASYRVIDGEGKTILPSLVDMQVHFREPGFEYKETIESGSKAAAAGGFTEVAIMPNTSPAIDNVEIIRNVKERVEASSLVDVHIIPTMTKNLAGKELSNYFEYKQEGIFAITDDGKGVQSDSVMEDVFREAAKEGLSLLQHCEIDSISDGNSIHAGEYAQKKNMQGIPSESEWKMIERDLALLEKYSGHYHVLHVSSKKSVDLVREAKRKGLNVTCEVTPHHLFLCDMDIKDANFKMNPPLRSHEDMMALQEGFLDGTIDIISTDHAPHSDEEKEKAIEEAPFGVIGLETAFPLLYSYFVKEGRCSLDFVINAMANRPREIFNLGTCKVEEGSRADLLLINTEDVKEVDLDVIYSKSHNTPFKGHKLCGWPMITIKDGEVIYER